MRLVETCLVVLVSLVLVRSSVMESDLRPAVEEVLLVMASFAWGEVVVAVAGVVLGLGLSPNVKIG